MTKTEIEQIKMLQSLSDDFVQRAKHKYIGQEILLKHSRGWQKICIRDMGTYYGDVRYYVDCYVNDQIANTQVVTYEKIIWIKEQ